MINQVQFTSRCYKIFVKLIFLKWGHWAHSPWQAFCILLICGLYLGSNDFHLSATQEFWVINELMAASTQGQNNSLKTEKFNHFTDCFVYKTTKQPLWLILFSLNWLLFFRTVIELTNCLIQPEWVPTLSVNVIKCFFIDLPTIPKNAYKKGFNLQYLCKKFRIIPFRIIWIITVTILDKVFNCLKT